MYQETTAIGYVARDPELKYLKNGSAVAKFSMATSRSYYDQESAQRMEQVEWHNITCFGKTAENCGKYVKKGSLLLVVGRNKTSSWEKDGVKHYRTEIIAETVKFMPKGSKTESGQESPGEEKPKQQPKKESKKKPQEEQPPSNFEGFENNEEEMPEEMTSQSDDIPF